MDSHAAILASLPGLEQRLRGAGVEAWLGEQPRIEVEGRTYVIIGGDRRASEAEAKLAFAVERGLVTAEQVERAASAQPLPGGVESVAIDIPKGEK